MDFSRYMYELRDFNPQELGGVQQFFLNKIFEDPYMSAYKMWTHIDPPFENKQYTLEEYRVMLKEGRRRVLAPILEETYGIKSRMAYKNVHKRFQRLEELKLIEEIEGTFDRGARYFRISKYGFMYLDYSFYLDSSHLSYYLEKLKENIVWKSLILQFFDEENLNHILDNDALRDEIRFYLENCIRSTKSLFKQFRDRLNTFKITLSQEELSYYFGLLVTPSLYEDGLRNMEGELKLIWEKIDEFEDRFPHDKEDSSAAYFPMKSLQETLEWNVKYLVFRLLSHKELSSPDASSTLGRDRKFRELAKKVKDDFQRGCRHLILT